MWRETCVCSWSCLAQIGPQQTAPWRILQWTFHFHWVQLLTDLSVSTSCLCVCVIMVGFNPSASQPLWGIATKLDMCYADVLEMNIARLTGEFTHRPILDAITPSPC